MSECVRANVRAMAGYRPGEQPPEGEFLKLNTNENPYPPSPRVFEAIRAALTGDRLRKYPDPLGQVFRQTASRILDIHPDRILIGNGSDDVLTIITRALVPEGGLIAAPTPSYLLYRTLAEIQGAQYQAVPFNAVWELDPGLARLQADLTIVANPNSPSGTTVPSDSLAGWPGPLVIDEAYADFAESTCLALSQANNRTIVTRSLSKSYALAGVRFGFAVAAPNLIEQLYKVKDSYNCDVLSLAAATAALEDQEYMLTIRAKVVATRARMTRALRELGFSVCGSQANFVWCRRDDRPLRPIYEDLKRRKILVRYMQYEGYGDGLRISVGTDADLDRLLAEITPLL